MLEETYGEDDVDDSDDGDGVDEDTWPYEVLRDVVEGERERVFFWYVKGMVKDIALSSFVSTSSPMVPPERRNKKYVISTFLFLMFHAAHKSRQCRHANTRRHT